MLTADQLQTLTSSGSGSMTTVPESAPNVVLEDTQSKHAVSDWLKHERAAAADMCDSSTPAPLAEQVGYVKLHLCSFECVVAPQSGRIVGHSSKRSAGAWWEHRIAETKALHTAAPQEQQLCTANGLVRPTVDSLVGYCSVI